MADLPTLIAALTSGDDGRAEAAAAQLTGHGEAACIALQELLHSEDVDVRWWAVRALAQLEMADKVTCNLVAALEDESSEVRQCAAMALCHHPDPQAIPALTRTLSDPDAMAAKLAANALTLIGPAALPALVETLQTGSPTAKLEAVRALAALNDPRAIPALMHALEQDSALLQYWAALGLDKLGAGMIYVKPD